MLRNLENKIEKLEKVFNLLDDELYLCIFQVDHENVHRPKEQILKNCLEMERAEVHFNGKIEIRIMPCDDCGKSCLELIGRSNSPA